MIAEIASDKYPLTDFDFIEHPETGRLISHTRVQKWSNAAGQAAREKGGVALKVGRIAAAIGAGLLGVFVMPSGEHTGQSDQGSDLSFMSPSFNPDTVYASEILASANSTVDWRCDPRSFFRSVEFDMNKTDENGVNRSVRFFWGMDNSQLGDPAQNNTGEWGDGSIAVCEDGVYKTFFQTNGVWHRGTVGFTSIQVFPERNFALLGTSINDGYNHYFKDGGEKINNLLNPRDLNTRVRITPSGLSHIEIAGSILDQPMSYTANGSGIIYTVTNALRSEYNGNYTLSANAATGDPMPGASFTRVDLRTSTPTATRTATVTSTAVPTTTATPRPTTETSSAGRNFGISTRPGMVTTSWIGEGGGGSADLSYALLRIDQNGTTVLPRTGAIPSTISIYSDTETVNSSFRCYTLVLLSRGTPSGNSDVLCALPTTASGIFASDFTYRLNQSNTAYLSWGNTPGIEGNAIVPLGREPILGTGNSASVDTRGVLLCVTLVGLVNNLPTGNTTVLCGIPGLSHLP